MQNLILDNIHYTNLDPMTVTWCATAQVRPIQPHYEQTADAHLSLSAPQIARLQRQQQRAGVRLLLQALLEKMNIRDTLDESSFPYRLTNSQYYVCFSHTGASIQSNAAQLNKEKPFNRLDNLDSLDNKVAVVVSCHRPAGIDIEANNVKWQVAQRFYHTNELAILQALNSTQRDTVAKLLWQIKESFIKIYQYTLAQGLGMDYSAYIPELIKPVTDTLYLPTIINERSDYHIAAIAFQQTVIVY